MCNHLIRNHHVPFQTCSKHHQELLLFRCKKSSALSESIFSAVMSAIEHFTRQGQLETAGEARPVRPAYRAWARYVSFRKIWAGAVAGTKHFAGPQTGHGLAPGSWRLHLPCRGLVLIGKKECFPVYDAATKRRKQWHWSLQFVYRVIRCTPKKFSGWLAG